MQQPINEQTNNTGNNQLEYYKKFTNITKPMSIATISSLRYKVERRAYDILALCERSENIDKLQMVFEYLSSTLVCLCEEESNIGQKWKPCYQKSTTQRRFYSTNKKRKIEVTGLTKLSNDQAMMSQNICSFTVYHAAGICTIIIILKPICKNYKGHHMHIYIPIAFFLRGQMQSLYTLGQSSQMKTLLPKLCTMIQVEKS